MNSLKIMAVLVAALALAACGQTAEGNFLKSAIVNQSEAVAATALSDAEWYICRRARVGAIVDRYGENEKTAADWRGICNPGSDVDIIGVPDETPAP